MTTQELLFFSSLPQALSLYTVLRRELLVRFPDTVVEVKKTQITFRARYGYAFVSLRRIRGCPEIFILVSFGLGHRLDSPRIAMAVEPYPGRWTHHMVISRAEEIDDELMAWLGQAHAFALRK